MKSNEILDKNEIDYLIRTIRNVKDDLSLEKRFLTEQSELLYRYSDKENYKTQNIFILYKDALKKLKKTTKILQNCETLDDYLTKRSEESTYSDHLSPSILDWLKYEISDTITVYESHKKEMTLLLRQFSVSLKNGGNPDGVKEETIRSIHESRKRVLVSLDKIKEKIRLLAGLSKKLKQGTL
jgi:Mg2+ and Co2+ transporter CorA